MKKVVVLVMVAALATAASAALLSEDFTVDPGFINLDPVVNPAGGQWYKSPTGANYNATDGAVRLVNPGSDGGISSIMIVQSGADLTAGLTYEVNVDFSFGNDQWTSFGLDVWDVDYSVGTISVQTRKWAQWNGGDLNDITAADGASAVELAEKNWAANNPGIKTLSFVYDGTGDIVVRAFTSDNGQTGWHRGDVSSVEIVQVPEPVTMMLLGMGGLVALKRRK